MGMVIGLVALLVTIAAVIAAAGHAGYLAMLTSAAKKRPGGQPAVEFAKKRYPVAGVGLGVTLLALVISSGGVGADVFATLLALGGGAGSLKALGTTQSRFRKGEF
ncbi:hypothetical protein QFW96_09910 [Saccharopolyspora sp. TS4A08]|uniref:DUF3784 domain-containing protein n=1 Tax=Saccharopolyspora ipomoeae TaxID=3042027 RepID=A0ABT6PLX7_9PSEU|nr:hypothetical protein [Saccharopolyspora sp. TS4A08]MDI2028927.1 hypothetical protein [Saccharopolyspora sp. TS4A08]